MIDLIIIFVMVCILVSLAFGLYFLVKDRGKTERAVMSLTIRVGLAVLLLIILGIGFMYR